MPILEGLDGVQKMSKSLGNYIGVTEAPSQIFGKIMSISDILMLRYYELLTNESIDEVNAMHPMLAKKKLARIIVERFYNAKEAQSAQDGFESMFSQKEIPQDMPTKKFKEKQLEIIKLLVETSLAPSNAEAKRLIKQGGVKIDGQAVVDEKILIDLVSAKVLQVGKRNFMRIICE
jgi:tyrosyl-tRNA synthetase